MNSKKLVSFALLAIMLLTAACTSQATTVAPTVAATTAAPVVATTEAPAETKTLTVMAAASLTESFNEIGTLFESQNPGVKVSFNFAGSQALEEQLAQGAAADVFASASKKYMTSAINDAKRVNEADAVTFAKNRLVVIYPADNPAGIATLADLAKKGVKIDLADKSVPVGQYALDFLDKAAATTDYGASYKDAVLANVVSNEDNVKAVLTKVSLGEADAGIVYVTDITTDVKSKVATIDIPDDLNTIATYPIAKISDSANADLAQAFVDLVMSADGQAILAKYGFVSPTAK